MKEKRVFQYRNRQCECCKSNDLEYLWHNRFEAQTRKFSWDFNLNYAICKNCGFVFVSPVMESEDINCYYEDCWIQYSQQELDYNIDSRIEFINKNCKDVSTFVEIGSNKRTGFHDRLESIFSTIMTVELNSNCDSNYSSIYNLPDNKADVIAHYFVLEHVPEARNFVALCHKVLKPGGIMIAEVPDVTIYKEDYSALLWHEHVNHFSINSLSRLVKETGFELLDHSTDLCSRSFGFAAAYRKTDKNPQTQLNDDNEYKNNKILIEQGSQNIDELRKRMDKAYLKLLEYSHKGKKCVLWCANNIMLNFLENKIVPNNTVIVDSDPEKKNYSDKFCIFNPHDVKQDIINSELIIIFSKSSSEDILKFIYKEFDKTFESQNVLIFYA